MYENVKATQKQRPPGWVPTLGATPRSANSVQSWSGSEGGLRQRIRTISTTSATADFFDVRMASVSNLPQKRKCNPPSVVSAPTSAPYSVKKLLEVIAEVYCVQVTDLLSPTKKRSVAFPRHVAMYLLREDLKLSFRQSAEELCRTNHATTVHSVNKIRDMLEKNVQLREDIRQIRARCRENVDTES